MLDNSSLIIPFMPDTDDGDTFCYSELLDRGKRKGNNSHRLLKTYYHRSRDEFNSQLPEIKHQCDLALVRAYTKLAPRSYHKVAARHLILVTEAYIAKNYAGVKTLYKSACGLVSPNRKIWMLDVDVVTDRTRELGVKLKELGHLLAEIPSRKGTHYIINPFDARALTGSSWASWGDVSLHKDNGTNLYIPDGAA